MADIAQTSPVDDLAKRKRVRTQRQNPQQASSRQRLPGGRPNPRYNRDGPQSSAYRRRAVMASNRRPSASPTAPTAAPATRGPSYAGGRPQVSTPATPAPVAPRGPVGAGAQAPVAAPTPAPTAGYNREGPQNWDYRRRALMAAPPSAVAPLAAPPQAPRGPALAGYQAPVAAPQAVRPHEGPALAGYQPPVASPMPGQYATGGRPMAGAGQDGATDAEYQAYIQQWQAERNQPLDYMTWWTKNRQAY